MSIPKKTTIRKPKDFATCIHGPLFDPAGVGATNDVDMVKLLAKRLYKSRGVRYDSRRGIWVEHTVDENAQPVWRDIPTDAGRFASALVYEVAPVFADGSALDEGPQKEVTKKFRATVNKVDGPGKYGRLLLTHAASSDAELRIDSGDLSDREDPTHLWAGGTLWDLGKCGPDGLGLVHDDAGGLVGSADYVHFATASCEPNSQTPTPHFDRLLDVMSCGRDWWVDYALNVLAVGVTGYSDRVIPLHWGDGGTGKTLLMSLVLDLMGGYGHAAGAALIDPNMKGFSESMMVELRTKRVVGVDEAFRNSFRATEHLKSLTGGFRVTAAAKYQHPVTFKATWTLVTTSNEIPPLTDPALRARLRPIHFEADPADVREAARPFGSPGQFSEVWKAERPGVLAMLMERAGEFIRDLRVADVPAEVEVQIEDLAAEQDPAFLWVEDECVILPGAVKAAGWMKASDLHAEFVVWCKRHDVAPMGPIPFGKALTRLGVGKEKVGGVVYRGLTTDLVGLPDDDFDDALG